METQPKHQHRPLRIGLHIDTGEYPEDYQLGHALRQRPPDRWADIAGYARLAEEIGFDSIWMPDHLLYRIIEDKPEGTWETFTTISALAAITTRVQLYPTVICALWRNPALTAKMVDTIDEISGGRFVLGLGAGSYVPEFETFGFLTNYRYSRFEEALQIIHGLLRTGRMDFEGRFYSVKDCELRPRGPRPEGPPIMIGTTGHKMLRLTARYADIWNGIVDTTGKDRFEAYAEIRDLVDEACEEVGRDPVTLQRTIGTIANPLNSDEYRESRDGETISGSAAEIAATLRRYADEGLSEIVIAPFPASREGIEAMAPVLEALDGR